MTEKEKAKRDEVRAMLQKARPKDPYEDFKGDLLEYMASKLQHYEVQRHELMEIAQYATMGMIWVANAEVRKAVHSMNRQRRGLPKVGVEDE